VTGGDSRQASVRAALGAIPDDVGLIVSHDAARPLASVELFSAVLGALEGSPEADGVVPVIPLPDTVKRVRAGFVVATEGRHELVLAQTPQAFRAPALREAHARAVEAGLEFTDDAGVLEWAGYRVKAVAGESDNFKITTAEDLARAEALAKEMARG
jgi:2-C-methyl-D-erythritol 4-phosphate cytidylyltransferase